jgi:hypothetical protein
MSDTGDENTNLKIAMLNYGGINNNPLEYGSMIKTGEDTLFNTLNEKAKEIFGKGIKKGEMIEMFALLSDLINSDTNNNNSISGENMKKVIEEYSTNLNGSLDLFEQSEVGDILSFKQVRLLSSLDKKFSESAPLHPNSFDIIKNIFSTDVPKSASNDNVNKDKANITAFFKKTDIVSTILSDKISAEDGHISGAISNETFFKNGTHVGLENGYFKVGLLIYQYLSMQIFIKAFSNQHSSQITQFLNEISTAAKKIIDTKNKIIAFMGKKYDIIFFNEISKVNAKELKNTGHVYMSDLSDDNTSAIYIKSGKRLTSTNTRADSRDLLHTIADTLFKKKYIEQLVINYGKEVKDVCYLHVNGIHCFSVHFDSEPKKDKEAAKAAAKAVDKAVDNNKKTIAPFEGRATDIVTFIKNIIDSIKPGDKYIISIDTNSSLLSDNDIESAFTSSQESNLKHFPENINGGNYTVNKTRKWTQAQLSKADDEDKATKDVFFHNLYKKETSSNLINPQINPQINPILNEICTAKIINNGVTLSAVSEDNTDICPNNDYPFDHFIVTLNLSNRSLSVRGGKRSHKLNRLNRLSSSSNKGKGKNKKYTLINHNKLRGGNKKSKLRQINFKKSKKKKVSHKKL